MCVVPSRPYVTDGPSPCSQGFVPEKYPAIGSIQFTISRSLSYLRGHPLNLVMVMLGKVKFNDSQNNPIAACFPILISLLHSFGAPHPLSVCIPYLMLYSSHLVILYSPVAPSCSLIPLFGETIAPIPRVDGVNSGFVGTGVWSYPYASHGC
jgi:hypothetical protein